MAGKDTIMSTQKELKRLHVIHKAVEGAITQAEGAGLTGISERQITHNGKSVKFSSIKPDISILVKIGHF